MLLTSSRHKSAIGKGEVGQVVVGGGVPSSTRAVFEEGLVRVVIACAGRRRGICVHVREVQLEGGVTCRHT